MNLRAVKHMSDPHWRHSLRRRERVTFAPVKGVKGWWAVKRIESPREEEVWDDIPQTRESLSPPGSPGYRSPAQGSVYVEGQATVQVINQAKPWPRGYKLSYAPGRGPGEPRRVGTREVPPTSTVADKPEMKKPEEPTAPPPNPYLHRGSAYSRTRGPAVRRTSMHC